MKRWAPSVAVVTLMLALTAVGCATKPASTSTPPDWVQNPPEDTGTYAFFVGSGSSGQGDLAEAEERATNALVAEIVRYLGAEITASSTAEVQASLDSFTSKVTEQVRQTGAAQVAGFRVIDRWIQQREDGATVYVLGRYDRNELESERRRLAALEREKEEAISEPAREASEREMAGDYISALRFYIDAAKAAATSDVDNAEIRFERNVNDAKNVLSQVGMWALSGPVQGVLGEPLPDPFVVKVGTEKDGPGLPDAAIRWTYWERTDAGRRVRRTEVTPTDPDGLARFTVPEAQFAGNETVVATLDLSSYLQPLEDVSRDLWPHVAGLEDLIAEKQVSFVYSALSRAREVPTGIVFLDVDRAQNPTGTNDTAGGVLESLTDAGFTVAILDADPEILRRRSDAAIVETLQAAAGESAERVVYGVVGIESFDEDNGNYLVKVAGTVKVVELPTGAILFSERLFKRSRGSNSSGAISAAFRLLGMEIGATIASRLP